MSILQNSNAISAGGYDINNSLRFRSSASAYLSRTLSSSGNRKVFTLSFWIKRGALGVINGLFSSRGGIGSGVEYFYIKYNADDTITVIGRDAGSVTRCNVTSTAVFRDPSAWSHIVISFNASATTLNVYSNNVVIANSTSIGNVDYGWNNSSLAYHRIGDGALLGETNLDGYITDLYHIDGQALTPSSFGETDTTTGVWKPKAYTGTYGTNGFYLKFSDIATTSGSNAGLGKDFSGNTNYWTTNNISVTSGTTYDAMTDSPTLTSATVANYAVMSPIMAGSITVTDGNLSVQKVGASYGNTNSTIAFPTSGKYYFEVTIVSGTSGNNQQMGMGTQGGSYYFVLDCYYSGSLIRKVADGVATTGYGTASVGTVIGVAVDADNGKAYLAINNTWIDSSSPTGGTGGYSMTAGQVYSGFFQAYNSGVSAYNFGQRPFSYTPPTGFNRLNTYNLPDSTIKKGNSYMDATLYTGNGYPTSGTQTITNAGGFKPDLIWIKERSGTGYNIFTDSVRGLTKNIFSNSTMAEYTNNGTDITSINSNGFSLGADTGGDGVNRNGVTTVAWQWQAGQGSTSSNTSGSITSTVSVNTTAGFSIVTYTGTGGSATVGHGLGVAPKMVIIKYRSGPLGNWLWFVYHNSLSNYNYALRLQDTTAQTQFTNGFQAYPTSSVFSMGSEGAINYNGNAYVAYCWAEIAGFSKFGSYTGNGSADGPFVYTGFRPTFIMWKRTDTTSNWYIEDSKRLEYNSSLSPYEIYPNLSNAEGTNGSPILLSNGFKLVSSGSGYNASGGTYIYMAFAENPFKNSLAR